MIARSDSSRQLCYFEHCEQQTINNKTICHFTYSAEVFSTTQMFCVCVLIEFSVRGYTRRGRFYHMFKCLFVDQSLPRRKLYQFRQKVKLLGMITNKYCYLLVGNIAFAKKQQPHNIRIYSTSVVT